MTNENCYASYLARIRTQNHRPSPCDTQLPPSYSQQFQTQLQPTPPQVQLPEHHMLLYKLMCQTQMKNKHVMCLDTFSKTQNALLCEIPVTTINTSHHKTRYLRIRLSAIITDVSQDIVGRLYLAFTDDNGGTYNVCHEYITNEPNKFSGIVNVEFFFLVPTNSTRKIKLYATSNSQTCFVSSNQGVYSDSFPVGPSYLTIEDVGGV